MGQKAHPGQRLALSKLGQHWYAEKIVYKLVEDEQIGNLDRAT